MTLNPHAVLAALTVLGSTADEIAASLRLLDVKERPSGLRSCNCPIAVYLQQTIGDRHIYVSTTTVFSLQPYQELVDDNFIELPDVVKEFIHRFDSGEYSVLHAQRHG